MEVSAAGGLLGGAFAIAVVMGFAAAGSNFCVMGAVSDWVNIGDLRRLRAWLTAMAVAVLGMGLLEALQWVDTGDMRIPYRSPVFAWSRYLLGGAMFGVGMTLASGCGNRNLVRLGGGNLKAVVVLATLAAGAWLMLRTRAFELGFHSWMQHLHWDWSPAIDGQGLHQLAAPAGLPLSPGWRLAVAAAVAGGLLWFALMSRDFRTSRHLAGGVAMGLCVSAGWWVTGGPLGQRWIEDALFQDTIPPGIGVQSYTFVSPMAETLRWLTHGGAGELLTFGIAAVAGVLAGSFMWHLSGSRLRFEWFSAWPDFGRHLCGGALMGIGGVLALGCTIGQGVTGISTLALGSFVAAGSMALGSALTMRVLLYRMVYPGKGNFYQVLIAALADLRLLPAALRRLDRV